LTIKEAFRRLCYRFHNKPPSKNKQERRARQAAARFKQLMKGMTGETELQSARHMQKVQRENKTPYVILGGSSKLFSTREKSDTKPSKSEESTHLSSTQQTVSHSSESGFKEITTTSSTENTTNNTSRLKIAIELKRKE
jgi:predicted negative regulator of RcsB-dependent stress response